MLRAMSRFIVLLVLAGACAGPEKPAAQTAGSGSGSNMVCHEVTDTGTLFSHTECVPADDKDEQTRQAQDFLSKPRSSPTNSK
jgi:hypothetical protein